jgi:hypothetical protein
MENPKLPTDEPQHLLNDEPGGIEFAERADQMDPILRKQVDQVDPKRHISALPTNDLHALRRSGRFLEEDERMTDESIAREEAREQARDRAAS